MLDEDSFTKVWLNVGRYLNQNDLASLSLVSKRFHTAIARPLLYRRVRITREPIIRGDKWWLDCGTTYISGYRSVKKTSSQNDLYLWDRIERFLECSSESLELVRDLIIDDDLFEDSEEGYILSKELIKKMVGIGLLEKLEIKDLDLFNTFYNATFSLENLRALGLWDFELPKENFNFPNLRCIKWIFDGHIFSSKPLSDSFKKLLAKQINRIELLFTDPSISSLSFLTILHQQGLIFPEVESLKFNFIHAADLSYDKDEYGYKVFSLLCGLFDVNRLKKLETDFSCDWPECGCANEFLTQLAPHLISIRDIGLGETHYKEKGNHNVEEKFDVTIGRFLLAIPRVGESLRTLCLQYDPPLNGMGVDNVEGNYYRRRRLFENLLPKLKSLQKLVVPRMLQAISPYEIVVCDLLWNGCLCSYCNEHLPRFDEYLMNHQYYSTENGKYEDIIPPVFFGYAGDVLSKRTTTEVEWGTDTFKTAPLSQSWNFHGYERVNHFHNYNCTFDEDDFQPLAKCISHFFNGYMVHFTRLMPNLRMAVLNGIYYRTVPPVNTKETFVQNAPYECIYD